MAESYEADEQEPLEEVLEVEEEADTPSEPQKEAVAHQDINDVLFKRGDAGTHVKKMQEYLNGLGFVCPMNGRFCAATEVALKAAQSELGLAVTGKLDGASCDALCG